MKKILIRCAIGTLVTVILALIFTLIVNVDMSLLNFIQSAVIFFVFILSAEIIREWLRNHRG